MFVKEVSLNINFNNPTIDNFCHIKRHKKGDSVGDALLKGYKNQFTDSSLTIYQ